MKRAILIALLFPVAAQAALVTSQDATNAIVGEAAGCPYLVKLGVADAIRNRGSLRGVYGFQSPVTRHSSPAVWHDARRAWVESAKHHVVRGATNFGNAADVRKGTFAGMKLVATLGTGSNTTYFFKP